MREGKRRYTVLRGGAPTLEGAIGNLEDVIEENGEMGYEFEAGGGVSVMWDGEAWHAVVGGWLEKEGEEKTGA